MTGVKHHDAQVQWNEIKWNEEYAKEKIEGYLEIYNKLGAPSNEERPKIDQSNDTTNQITTDNKQSNGLDDLDEDKQEDDDDEEKKRKTTKKSYYVRKCKLIDEELIEDSKQLPAINDIPLEPLEKHKRQPAQERAFKELSAINDRIASLVQVKQMDLSTPENRKQLMQERKKKACELRRLQQKQRASIKYRVKRRKIIEHLLETKPELHPQLKKFYRYGAVRPQY
ncbi:unnamed protein product [Rotaria sp. Silwood1]|nr:unnamed protein product [Rotaria sp. Silwood1]CAF1602702.1 unnamed protein product [Rotaria sp. Silwood1]